MFKKASVRFKTLVPILLLAIIAIFISVASLITMNSIMNKSTDVTGVYSPRLDYVTLLKVNIQQMRATTYRLFVTESDPSMNVFMKDEFDVYVQQNEEYIVKIDELIEKEEDKETFQQFVDSYHDYVNQLDQTYSLCQTGQKSLAIIYLTSTIQYAGEDLSNTLDLMMEYERQQLNSAVSDQESYFDLAKIITMVCLIAIVIVSVITLVVIIKYIVSPLRKSEKALSGIVQKIHDGEGDLTLRVPVYSKDEIGKFAEGVNVFIEELQNIMLRISDNSQLLDNAAGNVYQNV